MRMLRRAAVATVTAGSLVFLGGGVAHAHDIKVNKDVTQVCKNDTKKQKIVAKHNKNTAVGSNFICTQTVKIG